MAARYNFKDTLHSVGYGGIWHECVCNIHKPHLHGGSFGEGERREGKAQGLTHTAAHFYAVHSVAQAFLRYRDEELQRRRGGRRRGILPPHGP